MTRISFPMPRSPFFSFFVNLIYISRKTWKIKFMLLNIIDKLSVFVENSAQLFVPVCLTSFPCLSRSLIMNMKSKQQMEEQLQKKENQKYCNVCGM